MVATTPTPPTGGSPDGGRTDKDTETAGGGFGGETVGPLVLLPVANSAVLVPATVVDNSPVMRKFGNVRTKLC